jgi:predicted glutamine amidotransferase
MCGIFGAIFNVEADLDSLKTFSTLASFSQRRGSDASGLVAKTNNSIKIFKVNAGIEDLLNRVNIKSECFVGANYVFGHSRLSTHGELSDETNQPILSEGWLILHNGIVTNHEIFQRADELKFSDSAAIGSALLNQRDEKSIEATLNSLVGEVSCILLSPDQEVYAYTNVGNLYFTSDEFTNFWIASERIFLQKIFKNSKVEKMELRKVKKLKSSEIVKPQIELVTFSKHEDLYLEKDSNLSELPLAISDLNFFLENQMEITSRCSMCILPTNFPGLEFDSFGICTICKTWNRSNIKTMESLESLQKQAGKEEVIQVNLSGGRDSCYMLIRLHELGFKPYVFTYDWGLITTAARENMANLCGSLGVEHIVVSPNLRQIRRLTAVSLRSWFKFRDPVAIPALMAGDKPFFRYAKKISAENGNARIFQGDHKIETTHFKSALAGGNISAISENGSVAYRLTIGTLIRMSGSYLRLIFHAKEMRVALFKLLFSSAFIYYLESHPFVHFFGYEEWNEDRITEKLGEYGWVVNERNPMQQWRMGDATSPLYNFLYLLTIGYTENDAFKSNQIREKLITREEALNSCIQENKTDYYGITNYLNVIGFSKEDFWKEIAQILRTKNYEFQSSECF